MSVQVLTYEPEYDVVPHAIIWRPLRYFTLNLRKGSDELDNFEGASFIIGNDVRFDLRVYEGHPNAQFTVTLYLPESSTETIQLQETLDLIFREMLIPLSAIAWRRGQRFQYGKLERPQQDHLVEEEARVLVLKIAAGESSKSATARRLREEIPKYIQLTSRDMMQSKTRPREQMWYQIIRNVTSSHQRSSRGLFGSGLATKNGDTITLTEKGLSYLNSIGFIFSASASDERNRAL